MLEEKRGWAFYYLFASNTYPKISNWLCCNHPSKDISVHEKQHSESWQIKEELVVKLTIFVIQILTEVELKILKMGESVRTLNAAIDGFLVGWVVLQGAGSAEPARLGPNHQWGPSHGDSQPCAWVQPSRGAVGKFSPLVHGSIWAWKGIMPHGSHPKGYCNPITSETLIYCLSTVSYLINCWRSVMVRKCWVFLHWLQDSMQ